MAVIGNAMGEEKELYLYGRSETISGSDAYKVSPPTRLYIGMLAIHSQSSQGRLPRTHEW